MRLSEAIRLGSMLKPQAFNSDNDGGSCALRAAAEAAGIPDHGYRLNYYELGNRWPVLNEQVQCPNDGVWTQMMSAIYYLNDQEKWAREQIADWVATVEPPQAPPEPERTTDEDSAWVSVGT